LKYHENCKTDGWRCIAHIKSQIKALGGGKR
jgi:hypothetical protein